MNRLKKLLEKIEENVNEVSERKIIKTIPLKPSWNKMREELMTMVEEHTALRAKIDSKRKLMWATIEDELGIYDKNLHVNEEENTLDICEVD